MIRGNWERDPLLPRAFSLMAVGREGTADVLAKTVGRGIPIVDGARLPDVATANGKMPWLTTEGPKLYKRNGWYYVFAPSGSVPGGWQGVFRARTITGPYEGRDVLDQGSTDINGPHQGAWVTTDSGEDWFLHFQDTGVGMTAEQQARLFDPFLTTKSQGTGLGLAIVHKIIVDSHRGKIDVESTPGQGTSFRLWLPI